MWQIKWCYNSIWFFTTWIQHRETVRSSVHHDKRSGQHHLLSGLWTSLWVQWWQLSQDPGVGQWGGFARWYCSGSGNPWSPSASTKHSGNVTNLSHINSCTTLSLAWWNTCQGLTRPSTPTMPRSWPSWRMKSASTRRSGNLTTPGIISTCTWQRWKK